MAPHAQVRVQLILTDKVLGSTYTPLPSFLCPSFQLSHPVVSWLQSYQVILHVCQYSSYHRAFILIVSASKAFLKSTSWLRPMALS